MTRQTVSRPILELVAAMPQGRIAYFAGWSSASSGKDRFAPLL
jgi:hypothetical protein